MRLEKAPPVLAQRILFGIMQTSSTSARCLLTTQYGVPPERTLPFFTVLLSRFSGHIGAHTHIAKQLLPPIRAFPAMLTFCTTLGFLLPARAVV